jgi:catechol 2,3-dioxygenase-like lactoylglutathione lyase family enzyme
MTALIDRLDHLVLTTAHETACVHFYCTVLGMELQTFGEGRKAFVWNRQKINLHLQGRVRTQGPAPHTGVAGPVLHCGRAAGTGPAAAAHGIAVECGPVQRTAHAVPYARCMCATPI